MKYLLIFFIPCIAVACHSNKDSTNTQSFVRLDSPSGPNSEEPYLFTDAKGAVYLSWITKQDSISTLSFSELDGNVWSTPQQIASGMDWFVNWADYPQINKNDNNYIAHYLAKSGKGTYAYDVVVTQSKNGQDWSAGRVLNEDSLEAEHGFVSILPHNENFFLTWLDGRNTVGQSHDSESHGSGGAMTLRGAILDIEGNKLEEWELDNRICDCCQTSAANTDNGPVVVYRDRSDEEVRDISIVRWVNGSWTVPQTIFNDNWKINGCPVNGPRVDAIGNTVAIAWFTAAQESPKVKVIFSTDGGATFSAPIEVAGKGTIGRVDLALKNDKVALVSWMEGGNINLSKVSINGNIQSVSSIGTSSDNRSSGFPQMTISQNELIFAWTNDSLKTILTSKLAYDTF